MAGVLGILVLIILVFSYSSWVFNANLVQDNPDTGIETSTIRTFSVYHNETICTLHGRPIIWMFSDPGENWSEYVRPAYEHVAREYIDSGKVIAHSWLFGEHIYDGDDNLTYWEERYIPGREVSLFKIYDTPGVVPMFIFGCKYYRIGAGFQDNLIFEGAEFTNVIEQLLKDMENGNPTMPFDRYVDLIIEERINQTTYIVQ